MPPVNLLGDFGGGGMLLALGILAALVERARQRPRPGRRRRHGRRLGAAHVVHLRNARGRAPGRTSAAPTCSTAARRSTTPTPPPTASTWPSARSSRSSTPRCWTGWGSPTRGCPASTTGPAGRCCGSGSPPSSPARTGAEWEQVFAGTDACVSPVLSLAEAPAHPHARAPGRVRRGRRRYPAGPGAAIRPDRPRPARPRRRGRAPTPTPCSAGLGLSGSRGVADLRARGVVG